MPVLYAAHLTKTTLVLTSCGCLLVDEEVALPHRLDHGSGRSVHGLGATYRGHTVLQGRGAQVIKDWARKWIKEERETYAQHHAEACMVRCTNVLSCGYLAGCAWVL